MKITYTTIAQYDIVLLEYIRQANYLLQPHRHIWPPYHLSNIGFFLADYTPLLYRMVILTHFNSSPSSITLTIQYL